MPKALSAIQRPSSRTPVLLAMLRGIREAAFMGPDATPRLVAIAPFHPHGAPIVFVHGIMADPTDEAPLIAEAQARGLQTYVMVYDTLRYGASQNALGFALEFQALAASGITDLTVVAHSLGGMTTKASLDDMTDASGKLRGFDRLRFIALGVPWGGVSAADLALVIANQQQGLRFARDLAPSSLFWKQTTATPLSKQILFYNLEGGMDQFKLTSQGDPQQPTNAARVLSFAKRALIEPNEAHNTILSDPRTLQFVFDPEGAPDPATQPSPSPWLTPWRELRASMHW